MALTVEDIREFCKDVPELNILLEGEVQSSDSLITRAIRLTVSDFNSYPPATQFSAEDFPSDSTLLFGVQHYLALAEADGFTSVPENGALKKGAKGKFWTWR